MSEPTQETRDRAIHLLDIASCGGSMDYEQTAFAMGWARSPDAALRLPEVKLAFAAWFHVQTGLGQPSSKVNKDEFWRDVELEAAAILRHGVTPPRWETSGLGV